MLSGYITGQNIDQLQLTFGRENPVKVPHTAQVIDVATITRACIKLDENFVTGIQPRGVNMATDCRGRPQLPG